jgi:hypothetical protein
MKKSRYGQNAHGQKPWTKVHNNFDMSEGFLKKSGWLSQAGHFTH